MTDKIVLKGFCAYNEGDAQIDNMSFEKTVEKLLKNWKGQAYGKCTVIIEEICKK